MQSIVPYSGNDNSITSALCSVSAGPPSPTRTYILTPECRGANDGWGGPSARPGAESEERMGLGGRGQSQPQRQWGGRRMMEWGVSQVREPGAESDEVAGR